MASDNIPKIPPTGVEPRILAVRINQLIDRFNWLEEETVSGSWIDGKPIYRQVINMSTMPNSGTTSVAHAITSLGTMTSLLGIADNGTTQIILPSTDPASNISDIRMTDTNVDLETNWSASAYSAYAILEYTKTTD